MGWWCSSDGKARGTTGELLMVTQGSPHGVGWGAKVCGILVPSMGVKVDPVPSARLGVGGRQSYKI